VLYYETGKCGNSLRNQAVFARGWRLRARRLFHL
jgi:hypothetical protein